MQKVSVTVNWKRLMIAAVVIVTIIAVDFACPVMKQHSLKAETIDFVLQHSDVILESAKTGDYSKVLALKDLYIKEEQEYIAFLYGAVGFITDGTYYGFYYSPDDIPINIESGWPLRQNEANQCWEWKYDESENHFFRTQRVLSQLFYYESR